MTNKKLISILSLMFVALIYLSSCNQSGNVDINNNIDSTDTIVEVNEELDNAKQIFYSLPAPHEVASILIENNKTTYNEEILNSVDNARNYNTHKSMALNLGIYSADLSYASLFEQNQTVINYMATSKKLAEELGILEAFSQTTLNKLENNLNDRDAIIRIISETFMDTDAYLQENDKEEIAAMIIIGGWIEGMYIAIKLSEEDVNKNVKLVSSIVEQQLSLDLMITFLDAYKSSKQISEILVDINKLNEIFTNMEIDVTEEGDLIVTQEDYSSLCAEFHKIRNKFTENV